MNSGEVREILSIYRSGDELLDPLLAAAKSEAESDPDLASWFGREQAFDRAFAQSIASAPLPAGLKTRITATRPPRTTKFRSGSHPIVLSAAAIVILGFLLSFWRGAFGQKNSLTDYRTEMMTFAKLDPPLQLESGNMAAIKKWLIHEGSPSGIKIPPGLAALDPLGCRVLSFRGKKVTMLCFCRGGGRHALLFVVERKTLSKLSTEASPVFAPEGGWMTVAWEDAERAYLLGAQGDRALLEHYLSGS